MGQQAGGMAQTAGGALGGAGGAAGRSTRLGGRGGGALGAAGGAAPGVPGAPGAAGQAARGISLPGRVGAGAPGQPGGPEPIFKEEVRIVADEVTNSLVILATRRDYQLILDVVRRIDVVPRQVLLEVTIAEVTLNKDLEFGIAYAISDRRLNVAVPGDENQTIFKSRGGDTGQLGARGLGGLLGTAVRTPAQGAFAVITNREGFNVFINALAKRTNVKMLSAPHIIAADNREAHILVGDSIPILTSTATSTGITGTTGATVSAVQYRDTGKILTILPQVNSKGLVNMQIRQEVSAVGAASFGSTNSPSFSTREAETTVVVQDGETVIIGGIIDDSITHTRSGVPYLMDVPVLGRAFRSDSDTTNRTELLILISPYVVRDRQEAREVTDEFSDRLEGLRRLGQMVRERHTRYSRKREQGRSDRTTGETGALRAPSGDPAPPVTSPSP
jgi:general secretion pathway protein D